MFNRISYETILDSCIMDRSVFKRFSLICCYRRCVGSKIAQNVWDRYCSNSQKTCTSNQNKFIKFFLKVNFYFVFNIEIFPKLLALSFIENRAAGYFTWEINFKIGIRGVKYHITTNVLT